MAKVNVDFERAHRAIKKFKAGDPLTEAERATLAVLLDSTIGDQIPTPDELALQLQVQKRMDHIDPLTNMEEWNRLLDTAAIFENKYC